MINSDWKQITLKEYQDYLSFCSNNNDKKSILKYLEKSSIEIITMFELNLILNKWAFLKEDIYNYEIIHDDLPNLIDMNNKFYKIEKHFEFLSTDQYTDLDDHLQLGIREKNILNHIHIILAISCMDNKNYRFQDVEILANIIQKKSMYEMIPHINFFFLPMKNLEINSLSYLEKIKKILQLKIQTQILNLSNCVKISDGGTWFTYFQMKIYLIIVKYAYNQLVKA